MLVEVEVVQEVIESVWVVFCGVIWLVCFVILLYVYVGLFLVCFMCDYSGVIVYFEVINCCVDLVYEVVDVVICVCQLLLEDSDLVMKVLFEWYLGLFVSLDLIECYGMFVGFDDLVGWFSLWLGSLVLYYEWDLYGFGDQLLLVCYVLCFVIIDMVVLCWVVLGGVGVV